MKCDLCGGGNADFTITDFKGKASEKKRNVHLCCEKAMRLKKGYDKDEQSRME